MTTLRKSEKQPRGWLDFLKGFHKPKEPETRGALILQLKWKWNAQYTWKRWVIESTESLKCHKDSLSLVHTFQPNVIVCAVKLSYSGCRLESEQLYYHHSYYEQKPVGNCKTTLQNKLQKMFHMVHFLFLETFLLNQITDSTSTLLLRSDWLKIQIWDVVSYLNTDWLNITMWCIRDTGCFTD